MAATQHALQQKPLSTVGLCTANLVMPNSKKYGTIAATRYPSSVSLPQFSLIRTVGDFLKLKKHARGQPYNPAATRQLNGLYVLQSAAKYERL